MWFSGSIRLTSIMFAETQDWIQKEDLQIMQCILASCLLKRVLNKQIWLKGTIPRLKIQNQMTALLILNVPNFQSCMIFSLFEFLPWQYQTRTKLIWCISPHPWNISQRWNNANT